MERSGILCGGSWCLDRILVVPSWPQQETVASIVATKEFGGCPGHNMSSALKRLGVPFPVEAQGLLGDDDGGKFLAGLCDELGINRDALELRPGIATSQTFVITPQDTGRRTFFHQSGALAVQTPDDFDFSRTTCRIAHLGLPGVHEIMDAPWKDEASGWVPVLKMARAAGLKTNMELVGVDHARTRRIATSFLPWLDTLVINDDEAGAIAGLDTVKDGVADAAACRAAARKIMETFPLDLLVVHYPMGGIVLTRNGEVAEHPSVKVPQSEIKGSNGAGDCFAAGILFGHHEGWPIMQSLRLAHAAAAMSLRSPATTESVRPWKECLAQADAWGWR